MGLLHAPGFGFWFVAAVCCAFIGVGVYAWRNTGIRGVMLMGVAGLWLDIPAYIFSDRLGSWRSGVMIHHAHHIPVPVLFAPAVAATGALLLWSVWRDRGEDELAATFPYQGEDEL